MVSDASVSLGGLCQHLHRDRATSASSSIRNALGFGLHRFQQRTWQTHVQRSLLRPSLRAWITQATSEGAPITFLGRTDEHYRPAIAEDSTGKWRPALTRGEIGGRDG
jgi:hypothetical protein